MVAALENLFFLHFLCCLSLKCSLFFNKKIIYDFLASVTKLYKFRKLVAYVGFLTFINISHIYLPPMYFNSACLQNRLF